MEQLRAYVLEHREDDEAFYAFADKLQASPNKVLCTTPEEMEAELRKRIEQL